MEGRAIVGVKDKELVDDNGQGLESAGKNSEDQLPKETPKPNGVSKTIYFTTGSTAFDDLLGGGIHCGRVLEIFGEPGIGKTILCQTFAITCQVNFSFLTPS